MEIIDIPGLAKGSSQGEGVGNSFLADIRNCDALVHVIRCFDDENLVHVENTIDPVRDKETIEFELQVKDLESIDKRIGKTEKLAKSGDKASKSAMVVLEKCKKHLEELNNLRSLDLAKEDMQYIEDLALLTLKPVMYVCNVDDQSAVNGNNFTEQLINSMEEENATILLIAGKIEAEIAELEDIADQEEFLADLGLEEPGVNKLIRSAYDMLNLQTFLTAGPKEIRAWTIKKGMSAPEAAGVIHSDLQRGFIRAEVMKYDDFIELGSEAACRDAGKLYIEGKNYIVKDGDILNIRFNV
jgi:GTP-binding protein YchF